MKKLLIGLTFISLVVACNNKSEEERFIFEEERVLDMETGNEYYVNNMDTLTVVNIEGETSNIVVTEAPFSDREELEEMLKAHKEKLLDRKEAALEEQKERIKKERAERYAEYDDQELLRLFNEMHEEDRPYEQQLDVITELVRREAILETDAAKLLEVDTVTLDFDIDYTLSEGTE